MEKIFGNSIEIKEKPRVIQKNFAEVNADLAEYIRNGKPYPLDERLIQCFNRMMTKNQRIPSSISNFNNGTVFIFPFFVILSVYPRFIVSLS